MFSFKYTRWITLCGTTLWIGGGLMLSLRPAGVPPHSFRQTADLMPLFAIGLLMIGASFGSAMVALEKAGSRLFKSVCVTVVISSSLYASGVLIRQIFLEATGWEPLMPLGFLTFIISWTVSGVLSLKQGILSRTASLLMIASGISLLSFNDQFNPYGGVVFGLLAFLTVTLTLLRPTPTS